MRSCLFCADPVSSREDVWPLWLVRRFDTPAGVRVGLEREGHPLPSWIKLQHGHKVRFVCSKCNNGWMSDLENRAKPVLERVLGDGTIILDGSDQKTLALWSVKSAMVFEALRRGSRRFYFAHDRAAIRGTTTLPTRTAIWLARCVDLPGVFVTASDHADTPDHSPLGARLYSTTMGFGHLAIQVITVKIPTNVPDSMLVHPDMLPGPWEDLTLPLSDTGRAIRWPQPLALNGELGLETFAARWNVPPT